MAGSYKHIVNSKNEFLGIDLIDNLGDAHEALEECYKMICILADGDLSKIFEAHKAYVAEFNPEYAKTIKHLEVRSELSVLPKPIGGWVSYVQPDAESDQTRRRQALSLMQRHLLRLASWV